MLVATSRLVATTLELMQEHAHTCTEKMDIIITVATTLELVHEHPEG